MLNKHPLVAGQTPTVVAVLVHRVVDVPLVARLVRVADLAAVGVARRSGDSRPVGALAHVGSGRQIGSRRCMAFSEKIWHVDSFAQQKSE